MTKRETWRAIRRLAALFVIDWFLLFVGAIMGFLIANARHLAGVF